MNETQPLPTDAELVAFAVEEEFLLFCSDEDFLQIARAVLAKWGQTAHSGEPVAWLDPWTGTKVTTDYDAYGKYGIPLYTAPQPVEREPLTRQQLREAFYNDTACTLGGDVDLAEKVCRVVEKAHGIKQGGQRGTE